MARLFYMETYLLFGLNEENLSNRRMVVGFSLFILPLTFGIVDLKYSTIVVCAVATFAAIQEGHLIRTESLVNK